MAVDPRPKGATPPSDKEWISRALAAMPDKTVTPRPADPQPQSAPTARAANDDAKSIGELLRGLQLRPSYSGFLIASILSSVWIVAGAVFAYLYLPDLQPLLQSSAAIPALLGLGAIALVPVSFFYMLAHLKWRANELRLVTETMASLALRLAEPQATAQETISQLGDQMRREINIMTTGVERAMERTADLEARVNGQVAALERAHREAEVQAKGLAERLAEQYSQVTVQSDQVRDAVDAARTYSEKAAAMMQTVVADADARVETQVRVLGQSIENALNRFQQAIESRSRGVDDTIGTRAQEMMRSVNESGRDIAAALDRRIKDASVVIDARTAELEQTIGTKIEQLDKTLQHRLVTIGQTLDARIANFEDMASGRAHETAMQIEIQTKATSDLLDGHLAQMNQSLRFNATEASGLIEARAKAASEALVARMQEISQAIESRTLTARQSLGQLANDVEHKIVELCTNAGAALSDDAVTIEGKLSGLSANITAALTQNAQYVERTLLNASADAARAIVGSADQMASKMTSQTAALTALIDNGGNGLVNALEKNISKFTGEITRANAHAVGLLETQGAAFTRAVTENGGRIAVEISAASQAAVEAMRESSREAESGIKTALDRARESTTSSLAEMREVHSILRSEGVSMFERLREANILLREALASSQDSMSILTTTLGERLAQLEEATEEFNTRGGSATAELASHVGSFQDSGNRIVEELTQLAAQFDSHSHSLVQTVELIDNINRRTLDTVTDRGDLLKELIQGLDSKALDFEQRLTRFSTLLDESLETATTRTRDIGLLIAEASSNGVRAITEQYDTVRATVEQENQRTTELLRNVYQTTVGDTQTNLKETTERFTELLQGIKAMAAAMHRELEGTREELRRGVLDIPREAAESMTQMRKIIVDQVEALTELHRIVAKHGGTSPIGRRESEEPRPAPPRQERPAETIPTLPPAAPRGASNKQGWLTDLLNRAGGEPLPPERQAGEQTVQSLDGLASEIARMVDHGVLNDVWDRYNRGERNVFTRKLYTLQGQRAFDDIRARYKSDRDFKHTVDRYMSEFERLIGDVARDAQGQVRVRAYLTSETGKVYTMLAHAAGRLD